MFGILDVIDALDIEHGGNLIIMVGPPGAGKTTIAEQICDSYDNFVIVSPDKVREELTGDASNQTQNERVFSRVYNQLTSYLEHGKNVVYDATNCRSHHRYKIISVCENYAYRIICVMSTTPISDCIARNNERNKPVPEDVIEKMYFNLRKHPPIIFEGFDMIVRF